MESIIIDAKIAPQDIHPYDILKYCLDIFPLTLSKHTAIRISNQHIIMDDRKDNTPSRK